jgi:uncharacterized protein DUF6934
MKYDYYKRIEISPDFETYDFISEGIKGRIHKRIYFELVQEPGIYNLAFGDITEDGSIDDYSCNQPIPAERTRLYRMAISINFEELSTFYSIYGVLPNGDLVNFKKNLFYEAFIISKKS